MCVAGSRTLSEKSRIDCVFEGPRSVVHTDSILQLGDRDAIKSQAAVAVVIEGAISSHQLEWETAFVCSDRPQRPAADRLINRARAVEERFAVPKGQVEGSASVNDVPKVVGRWSVTLTQITDREHIDEPGPLGVRLQSQGVAPGVIHVKLHPMPLLLAEVHL